jgi:hypothetical protein
MSSKEEIEQDHKYKEIDDCIDILKERLYKAVESEEKVKTIPSFIAAICVSIHNDLYADKDHVLELTCSCKQIQSQGLTFKINEEIN